MKNVIVKGRIEGKRVKETADKIKYFTLRGDWGKEGTSVPNEDLPIYVLDAGFGLFLAMAVARKDQVRIDN